MKSELQELLEQKYHQFNQIGFIKDDPISIPHQYTKKQDIEITAFWTSMLAWGQRKTIINNATKLFEWMDNDPHSFIVNHEESERKRFEGFVHRTFNDTDALYFLTFLQNYYQNNDSLETSFLSEDGNMESGLNQFKLIFFDNPLSPARTRKHVSAPVSGSTCKRLNMFLRWMVRSGGVDFGIWHQIKTTQLYIPLDVHVDKVARNLGLIERKQTDWRTVVELTNKLKEFDANDPVKYDFALFGMGIENKISIK
jgi:uncharacterized protein (TIGR02757 family)